MNKAEMPGPTGFTMSDKEFEKYEKQMEEKEKRRKNRVCFSVAVFAAAVIVYVIICGLASVDPIQPDYSALSEAVRLQAIAEWKKNNPPIEFTMSVFKMYPAIIALGAAITIAHVVYYWLEA